MQIFFQQRLRDKATGALNRASETRERSVERLASGRRLVRGADGASGLVISRRIEAMRRSLLQAQRNVMDGVSMAQSAEQGVQQLQGILIRLRQSAIAAASGHLDPISRGFLDEEYKTLLTTYDRVVNGLEFNGQLLLGPGVGALAPTMQVGGDGELISRLSMSLRDLSLRRVGRLDPLSGAAVVSSAPLGSFEIEAPSNEASMTLGGSFVFNDTAKLLGSAGPYSLDGVAQLDLGAGPYGISEEARKLGTRGGPFVIPPAPRIAGSSAATFDVVAGENDTLRIKVNGVERAITLPAGVQALSEVVSVLNAQVPGVASVEGGALTLKASGEAESIQVVGGSARGMLGLADGATSTGQNGLVFRTPEGSFEVTLAEGSHDIGAIVDAVNAVKPGVASNIGGRLALTSVGGQTFMVVGNGSANGILGMGAGTAVSTDTFRYQVNQGSWQSLDLPSGSMSADQLAGLINDRTPGVASVVGGRVRLRSETGAANLLIGSGTANGVLGVVTGLEDSGENLLSLTVNGVTRSATLPAGVYSAGQLADAYNGLFAGVASVEGGRLALQVTGQGASIGTAGSTINPAVGLAPGASATTTNTLLLNVDGGGTRAVALGGGPQSAAQVAASINAVFPDLAQASGGQVVLTASGSGASIQVGNGTANAALGLVNGQRIATPSQGRDLVFSVNGESTTIHLDPGIWEPQEVVALINAQRPGFATLLDDGRLRLATQSVGTVNTVAVGAGSANGALGLSAGQSGSGVDNDSLALTGLSSAAEAGLAMERAAQAMDELNRVAAGLGAFMSASDAIHDQLGVRVDAQEASRARIEDVDYAREVATMLRADLTSQVALAVLDAVKVLDRSMTEIYALIDPPKLKARDGRSG